MADKPIGLAPMLSLRGGAQALDFYQAAFGAQVLYRLQDPSGAVVAQLSVQGAEFWLSDEAPEFGNSAPPTLGGTSVRLLLITPDPDALFARAVAAGAQVVYPVEEAHGWRVGRITDPFGHHWEIARLLEG